jgi:hypothetical protein
MAIWENFLSIEELMIKDTNPEVCDATKVEFCGKVGSCKAMSCEL